MEQKTSAEEPMRSLRNPHDAFGHDPMEADARNAAVLAAASEQAERELKGHPLYGGLGFCRVLWLRKKQILWQQHGIEWLSPADRNPCVLYE